MAFPGILVTIWPKTINKAKAQCGKWEVNLTMEKLAHGRTGCAVAHSFLGLRQRVPCT